MPKSDVGEGGAWVRLRRAVVLLAGTDDAPFRTATRAVAESDYGDAIVLFDGEYGSGESWPLRIKPYVLLAGASRAGTILRVDGQYGVQVEGAIIDMTISGAGAGTFACVTGNPQAARLRIENCIEGISAQLASIHDVVFRNVHMAIVASVPEGGVLTVDGADIELASLTPGPAAGVFIVAQAGTRNASIVIDHSSITAEGQTALKILADRTIASEGSFKVRRTQMRSTTGITLSGQVSMSLDLGTLEDPGQNAIDASDFCVLDDRSPIARPSGPVLTLSGTVLDHRTFESGTVVTGAVANWPYYQIVGANNRISF